MATSGTKTSTLYVDEIIDEALSRIGSEPTTGKEASSARRTLNIMMREWANRGIQLWTIDETTQTVTEGTSNYTLDSYTLDILEAVISRTENSQRTDFQMDRINREDYLNIPVKATKGRPSQFFLDMQRAAPVIYLYPTPDNSTGVLNIEKFNQLEDVNKSAGQNADMPKRFLPALTCGLSYQLAMKRPGIPMDRIALLKTEYEETLKRAMEEDKERASLF